MPNGHIARSDGLDFLLVAFRHVAILAIMFGAKLGHAHQHGG
jgi:hypothetical protein